MEQVFNVDNLIRPNIRELTPYHSARDDFEEGLLLDANENSLGAPYPDAERLALNRYPDPHQKKLRETIARWRNVKTGQVFTGVGSDEAIDLIFRIFCEPGKDQVIVTPPTYGMYKVSAGIHNIEVTKVLLNEDFEPRVEAILDEANARTKLLFLCSPNNPTGNSIPTEKLKRLLEDFPGIIVLDEAYIDFSDQASRASFIDVYPNLVVLQTMSKSFGMAGIRLGIAFASEAIIGYMMKVKAPYNVNVLTAKYALEAFNHLDTVRFNIDAIKKERARLRKELEKLSAIQNIYPSDANFLLVKIDKALETYKKLTEQSVIVRYRGNEPLCEHCLRLTVGTPDENDILLQKLEEITA